MLDSAGEILPYRMYVPTSYDGTNAYPLIIALHGLGGTEDSFFDGYDKQVPPASPNSTATSSPRRSATAWTAATGGASAIRRRIRRRGRLQDRSEQDVMQVLELVRQQYKIDDSRIYLIGHSLGAIGTWKIAPKYPDIWAAIAPISGSGEPATLERIKNDPGIHRARRRRSDGQRAGSRTMVAKLKELGHRVQVHRSAGRQPRRRRRAELRGDLRLLRRAPQDGEADHTTGVTRDKARG